MNDPKKKSLADLVLGEQPKTSLADLVLGPQQPSNTSNFLGKITQLNKYNVNYAKDDQAEELRNSLSKDLASRYEMDEEEARDFIKHTAKKDFAMSDYDVVTDIEKKSKEEGLSFNETLLQATAPKADAVGNPVTLGRDTEILKANGFQSFDELYEKAEEVKLGAGLEATSFDLDKEVETFKNRKGRGQAALDATQHASRQLYYGIEDLLVQGRELGLKGTEALRKISEIGMPTEDVINEKKEANIQHKQEITENRKQNDAENYNNEYEDYWTNKLAAAVPSFIPMVSGAVVSRVNPAAGANIMRYGFGMLSASSAGSAMREYEEYQKLNGREIDQLDKWLVGLASAGVEFATERIPVGKWLGKTARKNYAKGALSHSIKLSPKSYLEIGKDIFTSYAKKQPAKYKKFLSEIKDINKEGASESVAEYFQGAISNFYKDNEDKLKGADLYKNMADAYMIGSAMRAGISPISYNNLDRVVNQRRQKQGGVVLTEYNGEAIEVISRKMKDGKLQYTAMYPDGEIVEVDSENTGELFKLSNEQFKNLLLAKNDEGIAREAIRTEKQFQRKEAIDNQFATDEAKQVNEEGVEVFRVGLIKDKDSDELRPVTVVNTNGKKATIRHEDNGEKAMVNIRDIEDLKELTKDDFYKAHDVDYIPNTPYNRPIVGEKLHHPSYGEGRVLAYNEDLGEGMAVFNDASADPNDPQLLHEPLDRATFDKYRGLYDELKTQTEVSKPAVEEVKEETETEPFDEGGNVDLNPKEDGKDSGQRDTTRNKQSSTSTRRGSDADGGRGNNASVQEGKLDNSGEELLKVEDLAGRIINGESSFSAEDLQIQSNYPKELEAELNRLSNEQSSEETPTNTAQEAEAQKQKVDESKSTTKVSKKKDSAKDRTKSADGNLDNTKVLEDGKGNPKPNRANNDESVRMQAESQQGNSKKEGNGKDSDNKLDGRSKKNNSQLSNNQNDSNTNSQTQDQKAEGKVLGKDSVQKRSSVQSRPVSVGRKQSRQERINNLIDRVDSFNKLSKREKEASESNSIKVDATKLGFKIGSVGGDLVFEGNKPKRVNKETATSKTEGFVPLRKRGKNTQKFVDEIIKNAESAPEGYNPFQGMQGISVPTKGMSGFITDIKRGKNTRRAQEFLDTIDEYVKQGYVPLTTGQGYYQQTVQADIEEVIASFEEVNAMESSEVTEPELVENPFQRVINKQFPKGTNHTNALSHAINPWLKKSKEEIEVEAKKVMDKLGKNKPKLEVYESDLDLLANYPDKADQISVNGVAGVYQAGKVIIVASNPKFRKSDGSIDTREIADTIIHETIGHFGLRGSITALGGTKMDFFEALEKAKVGMRKARLDAITKRYSVFKEFSEVTEGTPKYYEILEEYVAHEVQLNDLNGRPKRNGVTKSVIDYIKGLLEKMGFKFSDSQLRSLIANAKKFVEVGEGNFIKMEDIQPLKQMEGLPEGFQLTEENIKFEDYETNEGGNREVRERRLESQRRDAFKAAYDDIGRGTSSVRADKRIALLHKNAKAYAEKNGLLIKELSDLGDPTNWGGMENRIAYNSDKGEVYKSNNLLVSNGDILDHINYIQRHNYLHPETPYDLVGFQEITKNKELWMKPIVKQKFVEAERKATQEEIDAYMRSRGYFSNGRKSFSYENGVFEISDLKPANVLYKDGRIFVIDDINKKFNQEDFRFQVAPPVESKAFEKFKGNAKEYSGAEIQDIKTGEEVLLKTYHGTTNEFYEFDSSVKGNIEGHLGKINYFTSEYYDAAQNYQSDGADLTSRIENLKERVEQDLDEVDFDGLEDQDLQDEIVDILSERYPDFDSGSLDFNMSQEEVADRVASSDLQGGEDKVMELYVKLNNPLVLGNKSTWYETIPLEEYEDYIEDAEQEIADEYGIEVDEAKEDYEYEIRDRAIELASIWENRIVEAMSSALSENGYDSGIVSEVLGEFSYESEVDLNNLEKRLRSGDVQLYDNDNGELASSQVIADFFKNLGYDGIILTDVSERFTQLMQGFGDVVSHIHVFDQYNNQIKLADGQNTTFDEGTSDIRFQKKPVKVQFTPKSRLSDRQAKTQDAIKEKYKEYRKLHNCYTK